MYTVHIVYLNMYLYVYVMCKVLSESHCEPLRTTRPRILFIEAKSCCGYSGFASDLIVLISYPAGNHRSHCIGIGGHFYIWGTSCPRLLHPTAAPPKKRLIRFVRIEKFSEFWRVPDTAGSLDDLRIFVGLGAGAMVGGANFALTAMPKPALSE